MKPSLGTTGTLMLIEKEKENDIFSPLRGEEE